eukprot:TRINITY_DN9605_c0_g1_i1.p1 TRINITY_DN9605_c0_g1~~TRINITY_DN9605_c0_g1_i1.p1  ORF type:complete len:573 (+),score=94.86 TRINITY_DN9605_c0_g1_i1:61-1779(+)
MDADGEAVQRINALMASKCERSSVVAALVSDENPASVQIGSKESDLLSFLAAYLQCMGARDFLRRTQHLIAPPKKCVAIYGGAFDPITNSHLTCAAEILHSGAVDEVWLVPCGPRPDKPNLKTPPIDRYCMCQVGVNMVFSSKFPVFVSDAECFSEEAFATYDLLCHLQSRNVNLDFKFVIGSDWLQSGSNLAEWTSKNWSWKPGDPEDQRTIVTGHKMLEEFDFLVIKRPGYEVEKTPDDPTGLRKFGPRLHWMEMPDTMAYIEGNLSSTEVRNRAAAVPLLNRLDSNNVRDAVSPDSLFKIDGLVPRAVLGYIRRSNLYIPKSLELGKRRKVAVYGGAFDPVTNSHLTCAAEIVHSGCVDEVWLVPCGPRPDKPNLKTPAVDRYCMCRIAVGFAFSNNFPVRVSRVECFHEEAFATYDLLCELQKNNPEVDLTFVIGSDWLQPGSNLAEWTSKNWSWKPGDPEDQRTVVTGHKMLEEFDFLVIKRPGYEVERTPDDPTGLKKFGPRLKWLQMPTGEKFITGNLSSTEIRNRARSDAKRSQKPYLSVEGLLPPAVMAYMRRKALYSMNWAS